MAGEDVHEAVERAATALEAIPELPPKELLSLVRRCFDRKDSYLTLLETHSSPFYLLDSSVLKKKAGRFREAFKRVLPEVSCYFAVKSNHHPDVAAALLGSGFGLDVSSGLELETALGLGARDIVFSGPGKTDAELLLAAGQAERVVILMDSFGELGRLERAAASLNQTVRAGVRLTTDPRGLWRKFGIPLEDLPAFAVAAQDYPHVHLQGLQFHTSWNMDPAAQVAFIQALGRRLAPMPAAFREGIEFIDIGGGYWPAEGEWLQVAGTPAGRLREAAGLPPGPLDKHFRRPGTPIETFADRLGEAIKAHLFPAVSARICFEPGRWICTEAMHLFISVVDKKASDLVVTDAGTNALGWERLETDYIPLMNLTRPALEEKPCLVLGSLCTPHDVWGYGYFGQGIEPGDVLMVPNVGAYSYSLRQHFIKPLPSVVTV